MEKNVSETSTKDEKSDSYPSYSKTIIWLTIIFFVITLILSAIFVYRPVAEIQTEIKNTIKKDDAEYQKIVAYVDRTEPKINAIINDTYGAFEGICNGPGRAFLGDNFCNSILRPIVPAPAPITPTSFATLSPSFATLSSSLAPITTPTSTTTSATTTSVTTSGGTFSTSMPTSTFNSTAFASNPMYSSSTPTSTSNPTYSSSTYFSNPFTNDSSPNYPDYSSNDCSNGFNY